MSTRTYHHLGQRQLRDWIHVELSDGDNTTHVTFVSRFHVGKRSPVSWSYATTLSDEEILRDPHLANLCVRKYGPDVFVGSIHI